MVEGLTQAVGEALGDLVDWVAVVGLGEGLASPDWNDAPQALMPMAKAQAPRATVSRVKAGCPRFNGSSRLATGIAGISRLPEPGRLRCFASAWSPRSDRVMPVGGGADVSVRINWEVAQRTQGPSTAHHPHGALAQPPDLADARYQPDSSQVLGLP